MKKMLALLCMLSSSIALASSNPGYLFFQNDLHATLVKNQDKTYTLTLLDAPKYVSYFSNRPQRNTGLIPLNQFLTFWKDSKIKDSFLQIPPNVALAMMPASGKQQNFIAVVSEPAYSDKNVSYKLTIMGKQPIETGSVSHVNMFFDDIPWNPGGF